MRGGDSPWETRLNPTPKDLMKFKYIHALLVLPACAFLIASCETREEEVIETEPVTEPAVVE